MSVLDILELGKRAAEAAMAAASEVITEGNPTNLANNELTAAALCEAYCRTMGPIFAGNAEAIDATAAHVAAGLRVFAKPEHDA